LRPHRGAATLRELCQGRDAEGKGAKSEHRQPLQKKVRKKKVRKQSIVSIEVELAA
jgi:hypothetical protein